MKLGLQNAYTKGQKQIFQTVSTHEDRFFECTTNLWDYIVMQNYLGSAYFEEFENISTKEGLYFKYVRKRGDFKSQRKLLVSSMQFPFGGNQLVVTAVRDMSYWLEVEKQKSIAMMQRIAFASAAHEFRNPLNAII